MKKSVLIGMCFEIIHVCFAAKLFCSAMKLPGVNDVI